MDVRIKDMGPEGSSSINNIILSLVDELIIAALVKSDEPLTAYKIAKKANVSWATANTHCYKLKSMGILDEEISDSNLGQKKMLWGLTDKTSV